MYNGCSFPSNTFSHSHPVGGCNDLLLPPILLPETYTSRSRLNDADALLKPRRGSIQKSTAEVRYKCPSCSFSCLVRVLYDHHAANAHGSDVDGPREIQVLPRVELPATPCPSSPVSSTLIPASVQASALSKSLKPAVIPPPYPIWFPSEPMSPPEMQSSTEIPSSRDNDALDGKFHVCQYHGCGYACNSRKYFERHLEYAHHKKRVFRCARCEFTSQDSTVYKNHLLEHLGL